MLKRTNEEHQQIIDRLRDEVAIFPVLPGVYLMKDEAGEVLYVGKARDLRARVRTYINGGDGRSQIEYLMRRVSTIEKIVCENERQAFLLERDLIAQYKPRYNIKLKDDKSYLSIRIDRDQEWPRVELVRRRTDDDNAEYFGPYAFSYELKQVLDVIKRVVPLRTCTDTVLYNRQRPCLEYQIKRCAGPCCLPIERSQYSEWVDQAISILQGKTTKTISQMTAAMNDASQGMRFEEAAAIRDRIEILDKFTQGHRLVFHRGESRDAFGLYREGSHAALTVLQIRNGRISGSNNFTFTDALIDNTEMIESALMQYYQGSRDVPSEVIVPLDLPSSDLMIELLKERRGLAVEFTVPQRGSKHRLLGLAELNASQHFFSTFNAETRQSNTAARLAVLCKLRQAPRRIECVDISNFQGSDIVGAIITFFDGAAVKRDYKKYKISQQGKPDDFQSIYEVVHRRLSRGRETGELPDLLVVDGGPGQLAMACRARDELDVELDIISLAKMSTKSDVNSAEIGKKPERIHTEWNEVAMPLQEGDEVTRLLQRLRDEVHAYVINFHRQTRSQRVFQSALDKISGIGPERKRRLLKYFGSVQKISEATEDEIAKIGKMPKLLAARVLHDLRPPPLHTQS